MKGSGSSALRRSIQALLDCGMISAEEVAFLYALIAEEDAPAGSGARPVPVYRRCSPQEYAKLIIDS